MVRIRFHLRPGGLRLWAAGAVLAAAGPAWAASSGAEALDAAVSRELEGIRAEVAGAPRRLPEISDPSVRPVAGQTTHQQPPVPPQPTPAQLEVLKQLEEMYKRDGRGPAPPLRLKDAPNTRLPNGQLPAPPPGRKFTNPAALQQAPGTLQHTSAPAPAPNSYGVPPSPAPSAMPQPQPKKSNPFLSFFKGRSGSGKVSFFDRLRGRSATRSRATTTTTASSGGIIEKLLSPFRKDEKPEFAMPEAPPAPPPLPEIDVPARFASRPNEVPHTLLPAPSRPLVVPNPFASAPTPPSTGPFAPAALPAPEREENPFRSEPSDFLDIVITPAPTHPLVPDDDESANDAFADIRDIPAPDVTATAALDPDFLDGPTAPQTDGPFEVESPAVASDDFAPAKTDAPATEGPAPSPQSTAARYAELQRKLAERAGLGGFQGFCPVAIRDTRQLVDSRPQFVSVYQGRTYELSSAEAKARFDADPTKYAPVNLGNDVVLTARGETDAEGNLQHAVWFKDRLYLFRTDDTLKEFNAEPTKYAAD